MLQILETKYKSGAVKMKHETDKSTKFERLQIFYEDEALQFIRASTGGKNEFIAEYDSKGYNTWKYSELVNGKKVECGHRYKHLYL